MPVTRVFPTSGLLASCAWARDLLQSVLGPTLTSGKDSQARVYVDDIALTVEGPAPLSVAQRMKGWLHRARVRLAEKNMVVNRDKEFLYGRSKSCLRVWAEAPPDYEGHLTQQVRDLGVCVRAYACKSHFVDAKLEVLKITAGRIGFPPVDRNYQRQYGPGGHFRERAVWC